MSMLATKLLEAQIRSKKYFGAFENRFSRYGAFKAFLDNANGLLPVDTLQAIKDQANGRDVTFPVLTKETLAIITARACAIAGQGPNSVKPTIAKITRGFEIRIYPKIGDNNMISETDQYAQQMANGLRTVAESLDTYAAAQLEAGKSTDLKTVILPGVTIVGNAYQIDPEYADELYFLLPSILEKNDLDGFSNNNITNTEAKRLMLQYESKAANNEQNLAAVLRGDLPSATGFRHYTSNRINPSAGVQEVHYLIPDGAIGVFTWNDSDAINKRTGANGQKAYLMTDPVLGIRWDVAEEDICDDLSGTHGTGFERTYGTKYQITADFGFLNAYSSDNSRANIKVEVLAEA